MREGWTYKKLKDIGVVVTGNTPSTKDKENYSSDDYCFVKPSDIAKDGVSIIKDSESYISEKGYNSSRKLPKGSVLTTCIGIIGKVGILEIDATCNQQINAIIPSRTILPKYLALAILSVRSKLEAMANAPVVPIINKGVFSNVEIPVPSFEEQERIVAELDLLTGIIDKQKQQLKELDTLAQAIFYDMFGNPEENTKCWRTEKFQTICTSLFAGGDVPKDNYSETKSETYNVPILSNGVGDKAVYGYTNRARVFDECITISGRGTIGYCEVRSEPFFPVVRLIVAVPNKDILLPIVLKYIVDSLHLHGVGVAIPQLTIPMVKNVSIILPSMEMQCLFAKIIQSIESQKKSINCSLAESQKLFDYTMDKYFG